MLNFCRAVVLRAKTEYPENPLKPEKSSGLFENPEKPEETQKNPKKPKKPEVEVEGEVEINVKVEVEVRERKRKRKKKVILLTFAAQVEKLRQFGDDSARIRGSNGQFPRRRFAISRAENDII